MSLAGDRDRERNNRERAGTAPGRVGLQPPAVDLIDGLAGIRRRLLRNWNRCEDARLRDTIRDAEEQIDRALQLLRNA
jgi:hypothetical protein